MRKRDYSGLRFGRLIGLREAPKTGRNSRWFFRCDCGNEVSVHTANVVSGNTRSCGCLAVDTPHHTTHGLYGTPAHTSWRKMKERCSPNHPNRHIYFDRGIAVCERWQDFSNFILDMGQPPKGCTLDRMNNDKGYSPKNCRWASWTQQQRNRRNNAIILWKGKQLSVAEAAEIAGIPYRRAYWLIVNKGMTVEDAIKRVKSIP